MKHKKHSMRTKVKAHSRKAPAHARHKAKHIQHHPKTTLWETIKTKVTHRAHIVGDPMAQHGRTNIARDAARNALPAGKRMAESGNLYWETRKNRSDTHNKKDKYHGRV